METIVTRTRKVGGSIMTTIPNEVVKELDIKDNEEIEISVKKRKKSYFGAIKSIGPFTEKDRFDVRE